MDVDQPITSPANPSKSKDQLHGSSLHGYYFRLMNINPIQPKQALTERYRVTGRFNGHMPFELLERSMNII